MVTDSERQRERHPIAFDDSKARWYHYALRRLPLSLLISFVTLLFGVPILIWLGLTIYGWFAG
jgi:hypothetical protein